MKSAKFHNKVSSECKIYMYITLNQHIHHILARSHKCYTLGLSVSYAVQPRPYRRADRASRGNLQNKSPQQPELRLIYQFFNGRSRDNLCYNYGLSAILGAMIYQCTHVLYLWLLNVRRAGKILLPKCQHFPKKNLPSKHWQSNLFRNKKLNSKFWTKH